MAFSGLPRSIRPVRGSVGKPPAGMIRFAPLPTDTPARTTKPAVRLVHVSAELLERVVVALAPGAALAGEPRCVSEPDSVIPFSDLRLGVFRRQREAMRDLIEAMHAPA